MGRERAGVGSARPGTGEGFGRRRSSRRCRDGVAPPAGSAGPGSAVDCSKVAILQRDWSRATLLQPPAGPARTAAPRSDARPRPSHGSRPPAARSRTEAGSGPRGLLRRLRLAAVAASALVLVLNGTAWGLYRDVTAGITTTDVITGGSGGGPQDILLVGVDSRTDAQGNPLPQEVLRAAAHRRRQPARAELRHDHPAARPRGRRRPPSPSRSRATPTSTSPATATTRSTPRTRRCRR